VRVAAPSEREAWAAGAYAVAKASQFGATKVRVGDRQWTRTRDSDGWEWQPVKGSSAGASTVTVTFP
jgi:hypothetical protein